MTILPQFIALVPHGSLRVFSPGRGAPDAPVYEPWQLAVLFSICGALIIWLIYGLLRYWKSDNGDIWSAETPFNRKSLSRAYIAAAAVIVLEDREHKSGKLSVITTYMEAEFPVEIISINSSFLRAIQYPYSIESLTIWLNRHASTEDKSKLIDFLIFLSFSDGEVIDSEKSTLEQFAKGLKLDWSGFSDQIAQSTL